jgi:hypothetical protein
MAAGAKSASRSPRSIGATRPLLTSLAQPVMGADEDIGAFTGRAAVTIWVRISPKPSSSITRSMPYSSSKAASTVRSAGARVSSAQMRSAGAPVRSVSSVGSSTTSAGVGSSTGASVGSSIGSSVGSSIGGSVGTTSATGSVGFGCSVVVPPPQAASANAPRSSTAINRYNLLFFIILLT